MMTAELVRFIDPSATPAQAALLVALSAPGVSHVLLSASTAAHWADALGAAARGRLSPEHLRKVIDVLGTCDPEVVARMRTAHAVAGSVLGVVPELGGSGGILSVRRKAPAGDQGA